MLTRFGIWSFFGVSMSRRRTPEHENLKPRTLLLPLLGERAGVRASVLANLICRGAWCLVLGGFSLLLPGCARHHQLAPSHYPVSYEKPLASPGAKFSALPPPVQNSLRAEVGSAEIADVVKDSTSEGPVYIIY